MHHEETQGTPRFGQTVLSSSGQADLLVTKVTFILGWSRKDSPRIHIFKRIVSWTACAKLAAMKTNTLSLYGRIANLTGRFSTARW
jgi:hypothetical protein